MPKLINDLSAKEEAFCAEYVKTYNAVRSYIKAFGCSFECANAKAFTLLRKPPVVAYIKQLQQLLVERYVDGASLILNELMDDITYRDENGNHSKTWLKSVDLAQKQLGLQKLKADIQAEQTVINVNIQED